MWRLFNLKWFDFEAGQKGRTLRNVTNNADMPDFDPASLAFLSMGDPELSAI